MDFSSQRLLYKTKRRLPEVVLEITPGDSVVLLMFLNALLFFERSYEQRMARGHLILTFIKGSPLAAHLKREACIIHKVAFESSAKARCIPEVTTTLYQGEFSFSAH